MAGRKKIFEIYPLDFGEYLTFNNFKFKGLENIESLKNDTIINEEIKKNYNNYCNYGRFPEVVLTKDIAFKKDLLQDVLSSYINIDLVQIANIKKIPELRNIIGFLAARIGLKLDISKIANSVNLSRQTVENYIY